MNSLITLPQYKLKPFDLLSRAKLWLSFQFVSLVAFSKGANGCVYDYVEIFDGQRPNSQSSLGKFCGNKKPAPVHSSTNELLLKFVSDQSITRTGFVASYTAESRGRCSGEAFTDGIAFLRKR